VPPGNRRSAPSASTTRASADVDPGAAATAAASHELQAPIVVVEYIQEMCVYVRASSSSCLQPRLARAVERGATRRTEAAVGELLYC
jgi:hypothetical protein